MKKDIHDIDLEIEKIETFLSDSNKEINDLKINLNMLLKQQGRLNSPSQSDSAFLEVSKLTKKYKKNTVVKEVEFSLEKGKFYGLIGPNGAGKTTLIKLIMSAIQPKQGNVKIETIETKNTNSLSRITYITEKTRFPRRLNVKQFYNFLFSQE